MDGRTRGALKLLNLEVLSCVPRLDYALGFMSLSSKSSGKLQQAKGRWHGAGRYAGNAKASGAGWLCYRLCQDAAAGMMQGGGDARRPGRERRDPDSLVEKVGIHLGRALVPAALADVHLGRHLQHVGTLICRAVCSKALSKGAICPLSHPRRTLSHLTFKKHRQLLARILVAAAKRREGLHRNDFFHSTINDTQDRNNAIGTNLKWK
jgi:hypothetical protein